MNSRQKSILGNLRCCVREKITSPHHLLKHFNKHCYNESMRPIVFIFIGLILLALIAWQFRPAPAITNYPSMGIEIVAFGDSLIAGAGATAGNDLVSQLENELAVPIINLGKNGDTSADGLARIDEVTAINAKVVLVLFGGNDALKSVPIETTRTNLETIITEIHETGAMVILLGVRSGLLSDGYKEMYADLAKQYNTAHVPDVLSGVFGRPQLMSDPIHPNNEGYEKILERVAPVLKSVL